MGRKVRRLWERTEGCVIFSRIKMMVKKIGRKKKTKIKAKKIKVAEY